jgi:hypothetical protein
MPELAQASATAALGFISLWQLVKEKIEDRRKDNKK